MRRIIGQFDGGWTEFKKSQSIALFHGVEYTMRIEVVGNVFDGYWDNELILSHTVTPELYSYGSIGLRSHRTNVTFTSLRIMFPSNQHY